MWEAAVHQAPGGRVRRYVLQRDGAVAVPYAEVLRCWREDPTFRAFFAALLADAPYAAYRWETPPVTSASVGRPFEFVLVDDPGLQRPPDPEAFAEHFTAGAAGPSIVAFPNLGNDAVLVVPRGDTSPSAYVHLASFVRGAPDAQKHDLWRAVAAALEERLGPRPLWLSTAGAGVAWLHVRLDSRPKYYAHRPYAREAAG